jgi:hypothetical protein
MKSPILFLIFNRPDTTQKVFDAIRYVKPSKLYIAADGHRKGIEGESLLCEKVRQIATQVDWDCEVKTLFRDENLGCKRAISSGIDWFFEQEEQGIILEDDCLPNPTFFTFCETLLDYYKDDERVMHIGGCNVLNKVESDDTYTFIRYPLIWGWATWRRAWKLYDVAMSDYEINVKDGFLQNAFPKRNIRSHWKYIFDGTFNKKFNTWDHQWTYAIISNNGLSVIPNQNTIINIGFSENATHTSSKEDDRSMLKSYVIETISHPANVKVNADLEKYIESKYFNYSLSKRIFLKLFKK